MILIAIEAVCSAMDINLFYFERTFLGLEILLIFSTSEDGSKLLFDILILDLKTFRL